MTSIDVQTLEYIRENGPSEPEDVACGVSNGNIYAVHVLRCVAASDWFAQDDSGRIHLTNVAPSSQKSLKE